MDSPFNFKYVAQLTIEGGPLNNSNCFVPRIYCVSHFLCLANTISLTTDKDPRSLALSQWQDELGTLKPEKMQQLKELNERLDHEVSSSL